jgi:hypothetical protein
MKGESGIVAACDRAAGVGRIVQPAPLLLALDPATSCGWAVFERLTGRLVDSGSWLLVSKRRKKGDGPADAARLGNLWAALEVVRLNWPAIDLVCFEKFGHQRGKNAARVAYHLEAVLLLWCELRDLQAMWAEPADVRRASGAAGLPRDEGKAISVRNAAAAFPVAGGGGSRLRGDDEADAIWVGAWACGALRAARGASAHTKQKDVQR